MLLGVILFVAGVALGGQYEVKLKTKNGLNITYTNSTGNVKNVF